MLRVATRLSQKGLRPLPTRYFCTQSKRSPLIVVAIGGNALLKRGEALTEKNQLKNAQIAARSISQLVDDEIQVVLTHGNGPQVGLLAMKLEHHLDTLDSESEGQLGYLLEREFATVLPDHKFCSLLTQVRVEESDPAFQNPAKPIGPYFDEVGMLNQKAQKGWTFVKDGDQYRRVVPSPEPKQIMEQAAIEVLVHSGFFVICCGGGGIPIFIQEGGKRVGVEGVIDKDKVSSLLAQELKADMFIILTETSTIADPRKWPKEVVPLASPITISQLGELENYFQAGSMKPKIQAAREFVAKTGGIAAIGALEDALEVFKGTKGTWVTPDNYNKHNKKI